MSDKVPIQQLDSPSPSKASFKDVVARAKNRGPQDKTRPTGTPRFDDAVEARRAHRESMLRNPHPGEAGLSEETLKGLEVAQVVATEPEGAPSPPASLQDLKDLTREQIRELFDVGELDAATIEQIAYPDRVADKGNALRSAVEARLKPLDIGQYLMNGFMTQEVMVIPATESHLGLRVTFKTISEEVEYVCDRMIAKAVKDAGGKISDREYNRLEMHVSLAVYIDKFQDSKWPPILDASGRVSDDALDTRLANVRKLPTFTAGQIANNLRWFIDRSLRTISSEILGNG